MRYRCAYRKDQSTEANVIKAESGISDSINEGSISALVLLDLSAAFDVIGQNIDNIHKSLYYYSN